MGMVLQVGDALFDVLEGMVALALDGAPIATLELPEDAAPDLGPASILTAEDNDEPIAFVGTLTFARAHEGSVSATWIGGAGVLGGDTKARHYTAISQRVQLADVVRDLIAAAGEQLDDPTLAQLSGLTLPRWTRIAGETWAAALGRALEGTGRRWRILDTGLVWVGQETWTAAELDGLELDEDKAGQVLHVGYDRATLRPGSSLPDGRRIVRVTFGSDGRCDVELEEDCGSARALASLVQPHLQVDPYAREWPGEVIVQNADGTVDVRLDSGAPFSDLPKLRYDAGVRGARYRLPKGSRVRVAFEGGRPDGAFARGAPTNAKANKGVARKGDHGITGTITMVGSPAGIAITYTTPQGTSSLAGTITGTASGNAVVFAGSVTINLETILDRVSEEVFLA